MKTDKEEAYKSHIQELEDALRDIILECGANSKPEADRIEIIRYTAKAALLEAEVWDSAIPVHRGRDDLSSNLGPSPAEL